MILVYLHVWVSFCFLLFIVGTVEEGVSWDTSLGVCIVVLSGGH